MQETIQAPISRITLDSMNGMSETQNVQEEREVFGKKSKLTQASDYIKNLKQNFVEVTHLGSLFNKEKSHIDTMEPSKTTASEMSMEEVMKVENPDGSNKETIPDTDLKKPFFELLALIVSAFPSN